MRQRHTLTTTAETRRKIKAIALAKDLPDKKHLSDVVELAVDAFYRKLIQESEG